MTNLNQKNSNYLKDVRWNNRKPKINKKKNITIHQTHAKGKKNTKVCEWIEEETHTGMSLDTE